MSDLQVRRLGGWALLASALLASALLGIVLVLQRHLIVDQSSAA
jgi:hypothetical protein